MIAHRLVRRPKQLEIGRAARKEIRVGKEFAFGMHSGLAELRHDLRAVQRAGANRRVRSGRGEKVRKPPALDDGELVQIDLPRDELVDERQRG